jgi:hypothetical protein
MREHFSGKRFFKVFATVNPCPLSLYDVLVYSYLVWQDSYGTHPNIVTISAGTGVCRNTVSEVLKRLAEHRLYREGRVVLPDGLNNYFRMKLKPKQGEHFCKNVGGFVCYVGAAGEGNPLSLTAVVIYSYLLNCRLSEWTPPRGWSKAYIGTVLGLKASTVSDALDLLEANRLAKLVGTDGGFWPTWGSGS